MMNGGRPPDVEEPLLHPSVAAEEAADGCDQADTAPSPPPLLPPPGDVDPLSPQLLSHLLLLLRAARAWRGAACLALLSVAESYVISRSGAVAGSFYKVLVDGAGKGGGGGNAPDASSSSPTLRSVFLAASCWYGSAALLASAKSALADGLAWAWRARLAGEMQRLYLSGAAHYRLARPWAAAAGKDADAATATPAPTFLDSPDQRIAQDLPSLTRALADASAVLAAAPFGVCWYAVLVRRAFGGALWPLAAAALFFALGALAQRLLVRRVARLVFALEAAEGSYRFAHARLRGAEAEGVALYSSCSVAAAAEEEEQRGRQRQRQRQQQQAAAPAELAALDARLAAVLSAEGRLIPARWALAAATRLIDYAGALLNYACVAAAVFGFAGAAFSGGGDGGGDDASSSSSSSSPGDVAQRVSVASFYLLTLIYSFTQVLDLSRTASDAAGLAARVGALFEGLRRLRAVAAEAEGAAASGASGSSSEDTTPPSHPLLELRSVRLSTAGGSGGRGGRGGALVVAGLSVAVSAPPSDAKRQLSSLLIVGPSGVGKTTLVRAIAGLATLDAGEVAVLSSDDGGGGSGGGGGVFFVPQRPLAAPGATLRLQLTYPHGPCACSLRAEEDQEGARGPRRRRGGRRAADGKAAGTLALSLLGLGWRAEQQQQQRHERSCRGVVEECPVCGGDARLLALLEEVGLAHLPSRLSLASPDAPLRLLRGGAAVPPPANQASSSSSSSAGPPQNPVAPDWASVLSPGELQRLAFARLLRANPRLAVLDEPVASLPPLAARALYASLSRRGIAYVSCGHEGGGLEKVHEATLRILGDGNGGWVIERN